MNDETVTVRWDLDDVDALVVAESLARAAERARKRSLDAGPGVTRDVEHGRALRLDELVADLRERRRLARIAGGRPSSRVDVRPASR